MRSNSAPGGLSPRGKRHGPLAARAAGAGSAPAPAAHADGARDVRASKLSREIEREEKEPIARVAARSRSPVALFLSATSVAFLTGVIGGACMGVEPVIGTGVAIAPDDHPDAADAATATRSQNMPEGLRLMHEAMAQEGQGP
jgi:hypothetical protein